MISFQQRIPKSEDFDNGNGFVCGKEPVGAHRLYD